MTSMMPRPPFDPELAAVLASLPDLPSITPALISQVRQWEPPGPSIDEILAGAGITREDVRIAGHDGDEIVVSILAREGRTDVGPGVYHVHGGGMILGSRLSGIQQIQEWITELDAIVVTVEYRLAPEFSDPYPVEDCYAGLVWTAENAQRLGIDPQRLIVSGASAGGGLAAGTALLARDRRGPQLAGQVLIYPMLDDRDQTVSTLQIDRDGGGWDRVSNLTGWSALLGERRGGDDVSIYAAPARATDLSGLPPAFIDCGSAEVFRDEDVAYATALWHAGVQAELHVWPGGFHAFDMMAPGTQLTTAMIGARNAWVARTLSA